MKTTSSSESGSDVQRKIDATNGDSEADITVVKQRLAELEDMERHYRSTLENLYLHQEELRAQNDELRHAQISLENARRRHQDLFDFSPVAQFLVGPNGMILKTNRAAGELLGLKANDLYNYHMPNLTGSNSNRVNLLNFLEEITANKMPPPITVNLIRRDGGSVRTQLHGSRSGAHQSTSILLTAVDNSHHAELDEERSQRLRTERLYIALLTHCRNGVIVTDSGWGITQINPMISSLTGFQPEEMVGKNLKLFAFRDVDDSVDWRIWQTLRTEGYWSGGTQLRAKSGVGQEVELAINAIRDESGQVDGYLVVC